MEPVSRRDCLLAALVAGLWGFNFVVIDWGMGDVPPLLFVAVRFLAVLVPAVFLLAATGRAVAHDPGGRGLHVAGPVRAALLAMAAGMPAGLAGLVLQAQVVLHDPDRRGRPARAADPRAGASASCSARSGWSSSGSVAAATSRCSRSACACSPRCRGRSATWSPARPGCRAGCRSRSGRRSSCRCRWRCSRSRSTGPTAFADAAAAFGWEAALSTAYTAGLASLVGYGIFNGLLSRNPSASVVPWILLVPPVAIGSAWLLLRRAADGRRSCSAGRVLGARACRSGARRASAPVRRCAGLSDPTRCRRAPPPRLASAARIRRALKSAARSSTSSSVQNVAERISRACGTIRSTSEASWAPPSKTRQSASSQPPHGGSQSVSSSGAGRDVEAELLLDLAARPPAGVTRRPRPRRRAGPSRSCRSAGTAAPAARSTVSRISIWLIARLRGRNELSSARKPPGSCTGTSSTSRA